MVICANFVARLLWLIRLLCGSAAEKNNLPRSLLLPSSHPPPPTQPHPPTHSRPPTHAQPTRISQGICRGVLRGDPLRIPHGDLPGYRPGDTPGDSLGGRGGYPGGSSGESPRGPPGDPPGNPPGVPWRDPWGLSLARTGAIEYKEKSLLRTIRIYKVKQINIKENKPYYQWSCPDQTRHPIGI